MSEEKMKELPVAMAAMIIQWKPKEGAERTRGALGFPRFSFMSYKSDVKN